MPIIRKHAVQGHYVPRTAAPARGPFPPEIFAANPRAEEHFPKGDSLHEAFDNVRYFRCRDCGDVMLEDDLDQHLCVEDEYELQRTFSKNSSSLGGDLEEGLGLGGAEGTATRDFAEAEYALDDVRNYDGYDSYL